jgi:hypothetical protein
MEKLMTEDDDDESTCRSPCDPGAPCAECAGYWQRMVSEGLWDFEQHCWTDKGWREIIK